MKMEAVPLDVQSLKHENDIAYPENVTFNLKNHCSCESKLERDQVLGDVSIKF